MAKCNVQHVYGSKEQLKCPEHGVWRRRLAAAGAKPLPLTAAQVARGNDISGNMGHDDLEASAKSAMDLIAREAKQESETRRNSPIGANGTVIDGIPTEVPFLKQTVVDFLVKVRGGAWRKKRRQDSVQRLQEIFASNSSLSDKVEELHDQGFGDRGLLFSAAGMFQNARLIDVQTRKLEEMKKAREKKQQEIEAEKAELDAELVDLIESSKAALREMPSDHLLSRAGFERVIKRAERELERRQSL